MRKRPLLRTTTLLVLPLGAAALLACSSSPDARSTAEATARTAQALIRPILPDELQVYAGICDQTIGATVPAIDCNAGVDIPLTVGGQPANPDAPIPQCDNPSHFGSGDCNGHQKLVVLTDTPDALVVGLCRFPGASGFFNVEIMQYNRKSGASCWYAGALDPTTSLVPAQLPAPSSGINGGTTTPKWETPTYVATRETCIDCHDNGAIIRSPFVRGANPATDPLRFGDFSFNSSATPYRFVGAQFASWQPVAVTSTATADSSRCTSCHRLGATSQSGVAGAPLPSHYGTAGEFGVEAVECTDPSSCAVTDIVSAAQYPTAPHWMIPTQGETFNATYLDDAHQIQRCASEYVASLSGGAVDPTCSFSPIAAFDPLHHIPGLAMWLDASRGTSTLLAGVWSWLDQSPHGNNATKSTSYGPVVGSGAYGSYLAFAPRTIGGSTYPEELQVPSTGATPVGVGTGDFALAVVANFAASTSSTVIVTEQALAYPYRGLSIFGNVPSTVSNFGSIEAQLGIDQEFWQYQYDSSGNVYIPQFGDSPHVVGGKPHVIVVRRYHQAPGQLFEVPGPLVELRVDGNPSAVSFSGNPTLDLTTTEPFEIGSRLNGQMQLTGEVYDVMFVQGQLSDWDTSQLEAFLKARHNL